MFAVRDDADTVSAIAAAVALCRERTGAVFAVSTWTGLAHLVAFVGAFTFASMPLGFAGVVPWRLVVAGMLLVTLAVLCLCRLALYGASGGICLHRGNAGGIAGALAARSVAPAPTAVQTRSRLPSTATNRS